MNRIPISVEKRSNNRNSQSTDLANNYEDVRSLLHWCQKGQTLAVFDPTLFQDFVQQIIINNPTEAVFKLNCGLELTEKLTKKAAVYQHFYRGIIKQRFNEPITQSEYLYSIIESEGDLIE